ncbi:reverse transcriptase domain-containing protein [Tanacetum coccineum]
MNERCSAVLLNELPLKEKDPWSHTTPCQVLEKHKEREDLVVDHSSRKENPHMEVLTEREITDEFFDEHLMVLKSNSSNDEPWYANFVNYIVGKVVPPNWTFKKIKRFFLQVKTYFWEEPYAFKLCADNIMRRCVAGSETLEILAHCHSGPTGGHHSASVTAKKVYESRFYWPSVFKDANEYVRRCDACQRSGNISSRNEMPQNNIQHKAHWALKQCNMDLTLASRSHLMQLNELTELRDGAYEKNKIYKERTKKWLDSRLRGDKILRFPYGVSLGLGYGVLTTCTDLAETMIHYKYKTATQRDEVIIGLTQQVQALQAAVHHRDTQIQQLQTTVSEMSSRESTLMQCILGMDRQIAELERRPPGPQ